MLLGHGAALTEEQLSKVLAALPQVDSAMVRCRPLGGCCSFVGTLIQIERVLRREPWIATSCMTILVSCPKAGCPVGHTLVCCERAHAGCPAGCKAAVEIPAAPCGPVRRLRTDWQMAKVRAMYQGVLLRNQLPAPGLAAPQPILYSPSQAGGGKSCKSCVELPANCTILELNTARAALLPAHGD